MKIFPVCLLLMTFMGINAEDISLALEGRDKMAVGQFKEAIVLFKKCIESGDLESGTKAKTLRNIGIALKSDGRPRESLIYYNRSIQLYPRDVFYDLLNRGNAYSELGEFDSAYADYAIVQMMVPDYGEIYYNRGIALEKQNKTAAAVAEFNTAYGKGLRTPLLEERRAYYQLEPLSEGENSDDMTFRLAEGEYDYELTFAGVKQVETGCKITIKDSRVVTLDVGKKDPFKGVVLGQRIKLELDNDLNRIVMIGSLRGDNYLSGEATVHTGKNIARGTFRIYPSGKDPEK